MSKIKMGKKTDKNKDKVTTSALSHESRSDRDSRKSPEPYICTGNFLNDFTELTFRAGLAVIPPVIPRPKIVIAEPKTETRGKKQVEVEVVEPELNEDGEPIESPPKTFLLKSRAEYFKPCVQVELDHNDKYDSVSEVYIRGWKIDESMATTLRHTLPLLDKLHTVNLWNTGLTGDTLTMLAMFLPQCNNLKTLVLDNNPVKEQNYHLFIGENSNVIHLSLRHCDITEKGAETLAQNVGTTTKYNTKLMSLNLSGNSIGDEGAAHLAAALRTNRSLLTLSLAANHIGDKGVAKLAETLSRFALTHEEVVERRKLLSTYAGSPDRPVSSRRADSRDRPASGRSQPPSKRDKSSKKKMDAKGKDSKEDAKTKKEEKTAGKKGASIVPETTKGPAKTKDTKKGKKDKSSTPHEQEPSELQENIAALLEQVEWMDELLWISGNMVLISLNLARNEFTEVGFAALLKAIQYQTTIMMDNRNAGTGLMRLCTQRNAVPDTNETVVKLTEMMVTKDPFYKPKTPEDETPAEPLTKGQ